VWWDRSWFLLKSWIFATGKKILDFHFSNAIIIQHRGVLISDNDVPLGEGLVGFFISGFGAGPGREVFGG
jgi:hypothetical protein